MKTTHCIFRTVAAVVATLPMTFALLTSCSEEEDGQATLKEEVVFSTSVTQAPVSRAEVPYEGSLTLAYGSLSATQQASYLYKDNTWTCTSTAPLYWQDLVPADGKYTFFALAPSAERGEVASDQSAEADFTASDWMVARTEATAIGALNFSLKHVLSQVMVRVLTTEGKEALTDAELASTTVTLNGLKCAYSVAEGTSAEVPAVATASGTAANGLKPLKTENIHRFIVPAQALEAGKLTMEFDVTIGSQVRTYIYTADAVTLSAGTVKQYDITLSRTEATLTAVKVTEWTTGTTTTGKLGLAISGDAATIEGEDPAFTTMSLWTGQAEIADNAVATAKAYTLTGTAWGTATDVTPFYLDDCLESTFYALAENSAADAVTGLTDLVAAGPASIQGGKLGLEFKHLLSQFVVNVEVTKGNIDLTGSTVLLKNVLPSYTLAYAEDDKTLQATASGTAEEYSLTPGKTVILAPQTLPASTTIVLTVNGSDYTLTLAEGLELKPGALNQLNLKLESTGLSFTLKVQPWETGNTATQTLTISTGATGVTQEGEPGFNSINLIVADAPKENAAIDELGTLYTYGLVAGKWVSDSPIYVDGLSATAVLYGSTVAQDAEGKDIQDAVTGCKDYLGTDVAQVQDGAVALTFRHLMAQLAVELVKGDGFTPSLDGATITTPSMIGSSSIGTDADGNLVAVAGNESKTYSFGSSEVHLVVPQTLAKGSVFRVTLKNGNTYTAGLAEALELEAGKSATLTLTLTPTAVGVKAAVTDWKNGAEASGTLGITITDEAVSINGEDPAFTTMSLWTGQAEIADNAVATAKTYTLTGTAWGTATDVTPFYLDDCLESIFYALAENSAADAVTGLTDLVAAGPASIRGGKLGLEFKHLLALLTVNVTEVESFPADLTGCKVTLKKGLLPTYTLSYAADGTLQATASGEAKDYTFTPATATIVAPQTVKAGTDFVLTLADGKTYSGRLEKDLVLNAATTNKLTLTLGPTGISLAAAVKDWTEGTAIEQEQVLTIDITGTPGTPQGSTPAFTKFTLELAEAPVKNYDATSGARLGISYGYERKDGQWSSTAPIYLDELTATSVVYGTAINLDAEGKEIEDAVTGLKDYLVTDAIAIQGGTAAIEFRHMMAQMTVVLRQGNGFTAAITDAEITTPAMISAGRIGTDANGNMLAVAGTATKQYSISSGDTHLVVPQTLAQGSVFSVKLTNGHTYTAKLSQEVTLEAGKNTTLTLTLTPTTVGMKATVADWGEAAAAAEVHLDGLTDGSVTVTASEGDQLTVTYAKDNLTAVYTYTGGQWTSTAPLYWDDIHQEGFTGEFSAVYTYKTKTAPAEDKLTGKATNVTYGDELSFSLAHTTAKLTFTFNAGEGVTEDDIKGFTKTLTLSGTDYTIAGDMHFAPYTLTDTDVITLTRSNGNTYTVKLTALEISGQKLEKLVAGQHYAITLTVNETSVGIQASIAAWTEVTGSGTMTPDFE